MKAYSIFYNEIVSDLGKEYKKIVQIHKEFKNDTEARHWVINHLDLYSKPSIFKIKGD